MDPYGSCDHRLAERYLERMAIVVESAGAPEAGSATEGQARPVLAEPPERLTCTRASVLVHIGYHKTGTTWLQNGLFVDSAAGFERPWRSDEIRSLLVLPSRLEWNVAPAATGFALGRAQAAARGHVAALSDERLSGSPHAGGFDSAEIAERLAAVLPDARVLIVIREQRRALYSVYQQYVRDGGAAALRKYLEPRRTAEVPQFRWQHFEYDRLVALYQSLFGLARVLVLPFELLSADPAAFLRRIVAHCGLEAHSLPNYPKEYPSLAALTVLCKRWANRLLVRNALNPAAPLYVKRHERWFERLDGTLPAVWSRPLERRWRELLEHAAAGRFEGSNTRTAAATGIDLGSLGYAMSSRLDAPVPGVGAAGREGS